MANAANLNRGDKVRVRALVPPGHVRTPWYLRGKNGVIERRLGTTMNPEQLAYGLKSGDVELLRVRFTMREVWGEDCECPDDTLDAEIFAHWLERIEWSDAA